MMVGSAEPSDGAQLRDVLEQRDAVAAELVDVEVVGPVGVLEHADAEADALARVRGLGDRLDRLLVALADRRC